MHSINNVPSPLVGEGQGVGDLKARLKPVP